MSFARSLASQQPEQVALRDPDRALTWGEVDDVLNRAVNQLLATELGPKRRIAVFAENSVETILAHLAGLLGGTSTVPVNFHLTATETAYILADSQTQLLLVGPENLEAGLEAAREAGVRTVVGWRCKATPGLIHWEDWLAAGSPSDHPSDQAPLPNLMYTSGTTGQPKGTELPPTMFAGGRNVAEHVERLAKSPFCQVGTHLVAGPLYHTGPLGGVRILGGGVPVVVLGRFRAEATLEAIEKYRCESSVMVPTHFVRLLAAPEDVRSRYDLSSLKLVFHTGSKCPVDVKRAMLDWWGPVVYEAYGATEVGTTCSIGPQDWLAHPGSVGKPNPPFSVLVVDDDGNEVAAGTEGRLYFADETGRGVVYHNDADKSQQAHLRPGVFTLGEIGYVDDDGFVFITDRFSDMILSGGVNIYPAESEQVIVEHPAVRDVTCIGIPHAEMGEQLLALVEPVDPEDPPSEAEIIGYCRDRLSHYKCPRSVEFRRDIGRNAMGKVNKKQLRAPYWETRDADAATSE
jgi:long-chain acyl-CoA synthetase